MMRSGGVVGELVGWYKVKPEDVVVGSDEVVRPVGKIRLRSKGSAAGHNGLEDIIHHLHTNAFPRLRVGIDHPANSRMNGRDYVLGIPTAEERIPLEQGEDRAVAAVELAITQGIYTTMNLANPDPKT